MVKDKSSAKTPPKKAAKPTKPSLPDIAPVAPTGDATLDAHLTALMSWDKGTLPAMKALAADRRPVVTRGLCDRVVALCDAIVPVSTSIKGNAYMNMYGETEHRLQLLGPVLEALLEHRAPEAEATLVALLREHNDERVRLYAARALLGQRLSSGPGAGAWDPALRASRAGLEAIKQWGDARPAKDVLAHHLANTAKQALAE